MVTTETIYWEDITTVNIYALNIGAKETTGHKSTNNPKHFKTPPLQIGHPDKTINKETSELNDTTEKWT
jgi:hypothetical protein